MAVADNIYNYRLVDTVAGEGSWNGYAGSQANSIVQPSLAVNPDQRNDLITVYQESRFQYYGRSGCIERLWMTCGETALKRGSGLI